MSTDLRTMIKKHLGEERVCLENGPTSYFFANIKTGYGDPNCLRACAQAIWDQMEERPSCIAGIGMGGMVLGAAITVMFGCKLSVVRRFPKELGDKSCVHGYVPGRGDSIAIVDDVCESGGTLHYMTDILLRPKQGGSIIGAHVVTLRDDIPLVRPEPPERPILEEIAGGYILWNEEQQREVPLRYLFKFSELR